MIDDIYQDKYFKADRLEGTKKLKIRIAEARKVGNDFKLVLTFFDTNMELPLNKANAETIATIVGSRDEKDWPGTDIELYTVDTLYMGKRCKGIRVREAK